MSDNPQIDAVYIPVEEAAAMLGVTTRQVSRLQNRLRTHRSGKRILYNRDDVVALASERGREAQARDAAQAYQAQLPPQLTTGQLFAYLREKDALIERLHQQLQAPSRRVGELEGQLKYSPRRLRWWARGSSPLPRQDEPPKDTS